MTTSFWLFFALFGSALAGSLAALIKFKLAGLDMTFFEFSRRLVVGGGYKRISAREFDDMRRSGYESLSVVDLRDKNATEATPFPNSISSPFDEFLKEVVVERKYDAETPIVLVCDTGHMSRVAANILVEDEGFTNVYNLDGGIVNWTRWQERASRQSRSCTAKAFASCCA
jgi:rhodanese-related sulfurtransferase